MDEDSEIFNYCSNSMNTLNSVSKVFLPKLFELQYLADAEELHEVKKAVR